MPGTGDDKYSRGVVGVVAGGQQYTGAAVMACTAAVCSGAGMVRYLGPQRPTDLVRAAVPEAVVGDGQVQAWVIGPRPRTPEATGEGVQESLPRPGGRWCPTCRCWSTPGGLDLLEGHRLAPTLLTPHAGELARLLARLTDRAVSRSDVEAAPVAHARQGGRPHRRHRPAQGRDHAGRATDGVGLAVRSQNDAPAWLATAGAGDVLAGLAGALLAAGWDPLDAGASPPWSTASRPTTPTWGPGPRARGGEQHRAP